jgi:predicted MPP superfamily phosphohydrolase
VTKINERDVSMTKLRSEADIYTSLASRLGSQNLQRRLELEAGGKAPIVGHGLNFFHWENWLSFRRVVRVVLRLSLLYGRARRNALDIEITHNDIHIPGLPRRFHGFKLLHLSDLHLDMNEQFPFVLSERIQDAVYDVCVLTGDFRYDTYGPLEPALAAMAHVHQSIKDPVYGVLGNHDPIAMVPVLEDMGIRMLLNESVVLKRGEESIYLAGIDDPHYFETHDLDAACASVPENAVSILLAHTPEVYHHAANAGFDVMFCGHTHGGQIRLPGNIPVILNAKCPRRFGAGPWNHQQLQGYTSVGAGSSIADVRLNCRPEITIHRLLQQQGIEQ